MQRWQDVVLTAVAPAIWGTTFIVTTELLPPDRPFSLAAVRALPAGLLLIALTRELPRFEWLAKLLVLSLLNFGVFWSLFFVAAYRLPGGVAATLSALQPLVVIALAFIWLGERVRWGAVVSACTGFFGVALLLTGGDIGLDAIGVAAALGSAGISACGMVLLRRWRLEASTLTLTAWQLAAAGLVLLPVAYFVEGLPLSLSPVNVAGFVWMGVVGTAFAYALWFRGILQLGPSSVSLLSMVSPVTASLLAWVVLDEGLTPLETAGMVIIFLSVWAGHRAWRQK